MSTLNHELHLHLGGSLSVESAWSLGKDCWKSKKKELQWYAHEFQKQYNRTPQWESYWTDDNEGFHRFKKDFIFKEKGPFNHFQAKINLLIALFKITPHDTKLTHSVLKDFSQKNLQHAEFRIIFPIGFTHKELNCYFNNACQTAKEYEQSGSSPFHPRYAVSLSRNLNIGIDQYEYLKSWQKENPEWSRFITAVDFSHIEEGFPPSNNHNFFNQIKKDNLLQPEKALAILYHVGESFNNLSIESSCRWIYEAHQLGAHRLGHAISLGIEPQLYLNHEVTEPKQERLDHLEWVSKNQIWLIKHGYLYNESKNILEKRKIEKSDKKEYTYRYTQKNVEQTRSLQNAIMQKLSQTNAIIESCPTSNIRIGMIDAPYHHPLRRFLDNNLNITIATDDPGIFDINLESEERLCHQELNISKKQIEAIAAKNPSYCSERLVREL